MSLFEDITPLFHHSIKRKVVNDRFISDHLLLVVFTQPLHHGQDIIQDQFLSRVNLL